MSKLIVAQNIARNVFINKLDKGGKPYIQHLEYVSDIAVHYAKAIDSDEITKIRIVGLLHDLVEDFPEWTFNHLLAIFDDLEIIEALKLLTRKPNQDYSEYITLLDNNLIARAVKLADLEHNMDVKRLPELNDLDFRRLDKYHRAYTYLSDENSNRVDREFLQTPIKQEPIILDLARPGIKNESFTKPLPIKRSTRNIESGSEFGI